VGFSQCRRCGAGVIWCKNLEGGTSAVLAVDAAPVEDGRLTITRYAPAGEWSESMPWSGDPTSQRYRRHSCMTLARKTKDG
jgi:hypothetical protein